MPPDAIVGELAPGERQLVEIAKALHREADLIIFDEPTTSLTPRETARLFDVIARLKAEGRTVIYISHILGDVARLCDRVAVLRDGRLVDQGPVAEFPIARMIRSMIGRDLSGLFPARSAPASAEVVFRRRGLGQPGVLENVSFEVRAGEILGLFGLMGSGRSELARAVFGLDPLAPGTASSPAAAVGTPASASPPGSPSSPRTAARRGLMRGMEARVRCGRGSTPAVSGRSLRPAAPPRCSAGRDREPGCGAGAARHAGAPSRRQRGRRWRASAGRRRPSRCWRTCWARPRAPAGFSAPGSG